jgi:hypothetical protein
MALDVLLGRSLAYCVHPGIAWRRLPALGRLLLTAAYFGAGYVATLVTLTLS